MLCNRPYQRASAAAKVASTMQAPRPTPFHAGGKAALNPVAGLNPPRKVRPPRTKKTAPSVTSKHKAWLASFAKERASMKEDVQKDEMVKTKRREKFMAREAAIRQQIKSNFKPKDGSKRKAIRKPAWAHTQETKKDEDEVLAEEELDQLIQFTENLDFDRYLDTEEVQEAMALAEQTEDYIQQERDSLTDESLVHPDSGEPEDDPKVAIVRWKWRLRMVEKVDPVSGELSDADDAIPRREYLINEGVDVLPVPEDRLSSSRGLQQSGAAVISGLSEEALHEWNKKFKKAFKSNQTEDDAISEYQAAKSALSGTKLGAVHSTNSISAIKKQMGKIKESEESAMQQVYQEPTVSTIEDGVTLGRLEYKKHVNQLPYMKRNPAM